MIATLALAAAIALTGFPAGSAVHLPADRGPTVRFERSGGFTGWVTSLTITPAGRAIVVDRAGARHAFPLTPRERRQVVRRLSAADLPEIAGRYTTPGAADLFVYRIASDGSQVLADQLALPEQAEPLVRTLTRLIEPSRWPTLSTSS